MPLSLRDRKMLWARSGNLCAFPGCLQALVEPDSASVSGVVIGEEAHIVARQASGPRGEIRENTDIDSCTNLVLLCPTHHRVIDESPAIYTVAAVLEMKRLHEERVRARSIGPNEVTALDGARFQSVCGDCQAVSAWHIGATYLIVCTFGSMPVMLRSGRWRGAGLQFHQLDRSDESHLLLSSSEAEPDIDYWVLETTLHVLQHTYDPDTGGFVPFVEHRFEASRIPAGHSLEVLLPPPAHSSPTVRELGESLQALRSDSPADAEIFLYKLRNAGLRSPTKALAILNQAKALPWYDGANAETGSSVERELKLIEAIRAVV